MVWRQQNWGESRKLTISPEFQDAPPQETFIKSGRSRDLNHIINCVKFCVDHFMSLVRPGQKMVFCYISPVLPITHCSALRSQHVINKVASSLVVYKLLTTCSKIERTYYNWCNIWIRMAVYETCEHITDVIVLAICTYKKWTLGLTSNTTLLWYLMTVLFEVVLLEPLWNRRRQLKTVSWFNFRGICPANG